MVVEIRGALKLFSNIEVHFISDKLRIFTHIT